MGAKSSKPVAQAKYATRKFPSRPVGRSVPPSSRPAAPTVSSSEPTTQSQSAASAATPSQRPRTQQASFTKDEAIKADGMDPSAPSTFTDPNHHTNAAFSQRLRQMGVATPNPTLSNSSIVNNGPGSNTPPAPRYPSATAAAAATAQTSSPSSTYYSSINPTSPSPATASPSRSTKPLPTTHGGGDTTTAGTISRGNSTTLNALQIRAELTQKAQLEFEKGNRDREFLDVNTLRQLLVLLEARHQRGGKDAMTDAEIEKRLNLKGGVVKRLGEKHGVFGALSV